MSKFPRYSNLNGNALASVVFVAVVLTAGCGSNADSPTTMEQQRAMAKGSPPPPGAVDAALKAMQHQGQSDAQKQAAIAADAQAHADQIKTGR